MSNLTVIRKMDHTLRRRNAHYNLPIISTLLQEIPGFYYGNDCDLSPTCIIVIGLRISVKEAVLFFTTPSLKNWASGICATTTGEPIQHVITYYLVVR